MAIFIGIGVVGILPLLFLRPAGPAGAGLAAGFLHPLESPWHILLAAAVGIWAARLGREAVAMLPLAFVLMLAIGLCSEVGVNTFPDGRMLIFGGVLLFSICVSIGYTKPFIISTAIFSAAAFYLGARYAAYLPDIASAEYYLLGTAVSVLLVAAAGVSVAVALKGNLGYVQKKLRKIPAVAALISLF